MSDDIQIYIGGDESYDKSIDGNFVLDFFMCKSEEDFLFLKDRVQHLNQKTGQRELKSRTISEKTKVELIKYINQTDYDNFTFSKKLVPNWNLAEYYLEGIKKFIPEFVSQLNSKGRIKIIFDLDEIEGSKFQNKCIEEIRSLLKSANLKIKSVIKFEESYKSEMVQIADILAGEYRIFLKKKKSCFKSIAKSKRLNRND